MGRRSTSVMLTRAAIMSDNMGSQCLRCENEADMLRFREISLGTVTSPRPRPKRASSCAFIERTCVWLL